MRFKLDENLPTELADLFRTKGFQADTVAEERLNGAKDKHLASFCRNERRVFVTFDLHFSDIRRFRPEKHEGIMVLRLRRQDPDHLLPIVAKVLPLLEQEPIQKRLWIIEEKHIRIRQWKRRRKITR
jgi:predicted nuclease of predicted toxin-antitoxin system